MSLRLPSECLWAVCKKKKKTRALICPGLDCRKALCGRPTAVSGRLGGPRCEVSPVMESVTVEQSSDFFSCCVSE